MTRVLLIGSSHTAAYKNASERFAALYPSVTLDVFGVRGPLFLAGKMNKRAVFIPPYRDKKDRAFVVDTNGRDTADASGYDHVLMVGHRFEFNVLAGLLENHDLLEGMRTGRAHLMSETLARDIIAAVTQKSVDDAAAAIAPYGKPVSFALAPYPASTITQRGDTYSLSRTLRLFWERPDAKWLYETWLAQVHNALGAHGHRLLEQPAALCDGPYATKPEFAKSAAGFNDETRAKTDHRHMNADFGLAMLCSYAETHLGVSPHISGKTALKERIA